MRIPLLLTLATALLVYGCGESRQNAADAISGINALRQDLPGDKREAIADGSQNYVLAVVRAKDVSELPAPKRTPNEVVENAEGFAKDGAQARDEASASFWLVLGGWLTGAGVLAAGIVKALGVGGPLVGLATNVFLSRAQKTHIDKQRTLASLGSLAVNIVEDLNLKSAKKAFRSVVSLEQEAVILEELARRSQGDQPRAS